MSRETVPVVLALDIGSSSVRCSAYDRASHQVAQTMAISAYQFQSDGTAPLADLVAAAEEAVGACLASLRRHVPLPTVAGMGIACFAMSWLGVDPAGEPITPVYTYATRTPVGSTAQAKAALQRHGTLQATYQRTGAPIHSAYATVQLHRLAQEEPALLRQVAHWQTVSAHLLARWSGRPFAPVSSSEASWTGLLHSREQRWDLALMGQLGLPTASLPPVTDYSQSLSGLADPYSRRWPELRTVPLFLAVGDGVAANIGSGCTTPQRMAVTVGTTAAMRIVIEEGEGTAATPAVRVTERGTETGAGGGAQAEIRLPAGLWAYRVDSHRRLIGGALTDGGSIYDWLRKHLAAGAEQTVLAEAAALSPDSHGLTILPFLQGERSPGWADHARLTIAGISPATSAAHFVRAGMEAVAYRLGAIGARLQPLLPSGTQVYASGTALERSHLWRQILADVLGRPVRLTATPDATSRGAAILAWQALPAGPGAETDLSDRMAVAEEVETVLPDPGSQATYARAARRQAELYRRLILDPLD